jgi:hypothetical protein
MISTPASCGRGWECAGRCRGSLTSVAAGKNTSNPAPATLRGSRQISFSGESRRPCSAGLGGDLTRAIPERRNSCLPKRGQRSGNGNMTTLRMDYVSAEIPKSSPRRLPPEQSIRSALGAVSPRLQVGPRRKTLPLAGAVASGRIAAGAVEPAINSTPRRNGVA